MLLVLCYAAAGNDANEVTDWVAEDIDIKFTPIEPHHIFDHEARRNIVVVPRVQGGFSPRRADAPLDSALASNYRGCRQIETVNNATVLPRGDMVFE